MKKKVIICMTSMYLGGAERSLIGLLEAFDYEKYKANGFKLDHLGDYPLTLDTKDDLRFQLRGDK
jgi:hypothetical protein